MGLERFAAWAVRNRTAVVLAALITTFAGVALLLEPTEGGVLEWLGIPLIAVGAGVFVWAVWPIPTLTPEPVATLAHRFLRWITWHGRLVRLFPAIGVGLVATDLLYNLVVSATPALQTEDTIVLLAAFVLVAYGFVPPRFNRERDFIFIFFIALNAILVAPLLLARLYYADFERSVDLYSWTALAPEASAILSVLGVANSVHSVAGATAPGLTFTPQHLAAQVTVIITTACSGIYSFGIFASAFIAFVLTEYQRLSRRVWLLLALGCVTAYAANVLRMVVIVLVGYYTDSAQTDLQNMLVAHSYAGWLIFLGWIGLFWLGLLKVLPLPSSKEPEAPRAVRTEATCGICGEALTPHVPARRCACQALHHLACLGPEGLCPSCGRSVAEPAGSAMTKA